MSHTLRGASLGLELWDGPIQEVPHGSTLARYIFPIFPCLFLQQKPGQGSHLQAAICSTRVNLHFGHQGLIFSRVSADG